MRGKPFPIFSSIHSTYHHFPFHILIFLSSASPKQNESRECDNCCINKPLSMLWAFLVVQLVKNLRAIQETDYIPGLGRSSGEGRGYTLQYSWAFLVTQLVKDLPTMRETWVPSLGWKAPLEKGTATHSSILAWRIPWTIPWGRKELDTTERLSLTML